MWTCSRCGKAFKNRNQWHSCGQYTEEAFLEGKTGREKQLYYFFKKLLQELDPVKISPAKTKIAFIDVITFATVDKINNGKVCAHVLLRKKSASKKFVKIEGPIHGWYVHHFCFADRSFFDEEMLSCLRASYRLRTAS